MFWTIGLSLLLLYMSAGCRSLGSLIGITQILQEIVDSSASKPELVPDTNYMIEKTYHIAPYLGAFGAYLMPK